jgi:KRAB domain-containing zinc finger protein
MKRRAISRSRLNQHKNTHSDEKKYSCVICSKIFKSAQAARLHCSDQKPEYFCGVCNIKCIGKRKLQQHMKIHDDEVTYACTICSIVYRQPSELAKHLLHHTAEMKYRCFDCNKDFKLASNLRTHSCSSVLKLP